MLLSLSCLHHQLNPVRCEFVVSYICKTWLRIVVSCGLGVELAWGLKATSIALDDRDFGKFNSCQEFFDVENKTKWPT